MPYDNYAFTRRPSTLSLGYQWDFGEADSGDNPATTNRIEVGPMEL